MNYLNIVALMVVTTFAEQPVVNNVVDIELIKQRVAILNCGSVKAINPKNRDSIPWIPKR